MDTTTIVKGTVELYCEICDYASPEKEVNIESGKTLHVGCRQCKKELLQVIYVIERRQDKTLKIIQDPKNLIIQGCGSHDKPALLIPGDTYTTLYTLNYPVLGSVRINIPNI